MLTAALAAALVLASAAAAQPSARSDDGRWHLSADEGGLALREVGGPVLRRYVAQSLDGRERGQVHQLIALAARRSFLVSFSGLAEWWEISIDPRAEPIYDGLVHDHRMGEAIAAAGHLGVRRTRLPEPLAVLSIDASGFVLARGADTAAGRAVLQVVQLDLRKAITRFEVSPGLVP